MNIKEIKASDLQKAFIAAAAALDAKKDWINELNVFPVPDGDTGTNMTLTISSAARDVVMLNNPDMKELCKCISSGSLRGARGNSGVILSQLLRGLCKEFSEYDSITPIVITAACSRAVDTAFKAVMKPKEGTILTVARAMSDAAVRQLNVTEDLGEFIEEIIKEGDIALANTPELLPVLKQAGVVDSGGQGLMVAVKGAYEALSGNEAASDFCFDQKEGPLNYTLQNKDSVDTADIKFGYCTEFIIKKGMTEDQEMDFKKYLESVGDSIVCVADDDLTKIHVHTNDPGDVISKALLHGELTRMKIDNMREEHNELLNLKSQPSSNNSELPEKKELKPYGFITVCCGDGLEELAEGLGCDHIISGGQTMNPSTEDFLKAISKVDARTVFIFPNNSNVILAASQAADLTVDKDIRVIPSKNFPQFVAGMLAFDESSDAETNKMQLTDVLTSVKSAEVTYSIRNTLINDVTVNEGDVMYIADKGIIAAGSERDAIILQGLDSMVDADSELITLYYGQNIDESEAEKLSQTVSNKFPEVEVSVNYGGQPVYYYLISVE